MFEEVSYYMILGKPLLMYLGVLTLFFLLVTASIAVLNKRGIAKIPIQWHFRMAKLTILLALVHGLFGVLAYF